MPTAWSASLAAAAAIDAGREGANLSLMTNMVQQLATALAGRYEVKVLKPELAAVLGSERFVVEIKTTAALQHPHILPLFDSGTAGGSLYYVMPYLQGETIREKLNRETQFGVDDALRIAREVADALDYAHRHGIIHRDI